MQGLHFKNLKGSQQGFTLVTVLIMSMMAGVLVLNSLKDNVAQERLSGNFQKKMNARLVAEKGVFDTYNYLNAQLAANPDQTLDQLIAAMQTSGSASGISNMSYNLTTNIPTGSNQLFLQSDGERFDGETKLKANFELVSGSSQSSSGFGGGIIGCEDILLSGSGIIDSYDSSLGDYNSNPASGEINKNANATVRTLSDGVINLSGASNIDGDLIAIGKVEFGGSATISGNVHSNDSISFKGNSHIGGNVSAYTSFNQRSGSIAGSIHANSSVDIGETPVGGDITSAGKVTANGKTIGGDILSQGDISLTRVTVTGLAQTYANYLQNEGSTFGVRAKQNVTLLNSYSVILNNNLTYAGVGSFAKEWSGAADSAYLGLPYKVSPPQPEIPQVPSVEKIPTDDGSLNPDDPNDLTCDALNIKSAIETVLEFNTGPSDLTVKGSGEIYTLSNTLGEFTLGGTDEPVLATNARFLGETKNILMYDNVIIKGDIEVKPGHNVVLFTKGRFELSGASSLTIPDNSSLTLILMGNLIIGSGSRVNTPSNGLTQEGIPVFSIYSSSSGTGIKLNGGLEDIYAAIYAPLTNVTIASSVDFKGSILGKVVDISGAGGIHYDEALGLGHAGNVVEASPPSLVFKGWQSL